MATIILDQSSPGAPALSGTNGALCAVLDWALVQNGWAVEYTATNARVYRPGTGLRNRLHVRHDSAISGAATLATIRGCEAAASATAITDPFPLVSQVTDANSTVCVSNAAGATARPYIIILSPTFVLMAISTQSSNSQFWDFFVFGDVEPTFSEDAFNTIVGVGLNNSSTATSARLLGSSLSGVPASGALFWCRTVDGSIKSSRGNFAGSSGTSNANFSSSDYPITARGGFMNRILREKVGAHCFGTASTSPIGTMALSRRGWIPNLWNPLHSNIGSVSSDDTFQDTGYNASALFQIIPAISGRFAIIEKSDTWAAPVG